MEDAGCAARGEGRSGVQTSSSTNFARLRLASYAVRPGRVTLERQEKMSHYMYWWWLGRGMVGGKKKAWAKTYNSGDSLVVTHLTTNPPVHCLYMAERTGSLILNVLWSYVKFLMILLKITSNVDQENLTARAVVEHHAYTCTNIEHSVVTNGTECQWSCEMLHELQARWRPCTFTDRFER